MPDPTRTADLGRLMRAAQDGDADAYRELLHAITPRIRSIIAKRRGFAGPDVVEDLVQEVLLSVHTARATYDPARPFLPWLLAILRYRLADDARRYARGRIHEVALDDLDVTFSSGGANPQQERQGELRIMHDAIRALPAGQRQALELLKLGELSLKDAAAQTGLSVAALKVATHRAMASLRRAFGATGSGNAD
jgi:RNA polymerase sigma-70 factor (ECF subfamily)